MMENLYVYVYVLCRFAVYGRLVCCILSGLRPKYVTNSLIYDNKDEEARLLIEVLQ